MGNLILYNPNFVQNFRSQAPKFGNFQFTRPLVLTFLVHKTPNLEIFSSQDPLSEAMISSKALHFGNPGRTPLPEKKLNASPGLSAHSLPMPTLLMA